MTTGRNLPSKSETVTIAAIETGVPSLVEARTLILEFQSMIRNKTAVGLKNWLERANQSLVTSFARGVTEFTVVAPDLRGYGDSSKPESSPNHETYSKRAMARDAIAMMRRLGFDRFNVAGHDRGGRCAYRLALDFP